MDGYLKTLDMKGTINHEIWISDCSALTDVAFRDDGTLFVSAMDGGIRTVDIPNRKIELLPILDRPPKVDEEGNPVTPSAKIEQKSVEIGGPVRCIYQHEE